MINHNTLIQVLNEALSAFNLSSTDTANLVISDLDVEFRGLGDEMSGVIRIEFSPSEDEAYTGDDTLPPVRELVVDVDIEEETESVIFEETREEDFVEQEIDWDKELEVFKPTIPNEYGMRNQPRFNFWEQN